MYILKQYLKTFLKLLCNLKKTEPDGRLGGGGDGAAPFVLIDVWTQSQAAQAVNLFVVRVSGYILQTL